MLCVVEIACKPQGRHLYPVPTTFRIVKFFHKAEDALLWKDISHAPPPEKPGQNVYQILWDTDTHLFLDRSTTNENLESNTGDWLPESKRIITDTTGIQLEPVAPEKQRERARVKERLQHQAGERKANGPPRARAIYGPGPLAAGRTSGPRHAFV
jgi:hypothetical protein